MLAPLAHNPAPLWLPRIVVAAVAPGRLDNFNRVNGALGMPSDGGSAWVTPGSSAGGTISGNAVQCAGNVANASYLECGAADVDVVATVGAIDAAFGRMWLGTRISDQQNYIYLTVRQGATPGAAGGGSVVLTKRVGGTETVLGGTVTGVTIQAGDTFRLRAQGSTLSVYRTPAGGGSETLITSQTDSFNSTETKHGIAGTFGGGTGRWDDLTITPA